MVVKAYAAVFELGELGAAAAPDAGAPEGDFEQPMQPITARQSAMEYFTLLLFCGEGSPLFFCVR
jgi:hypothetical protein